MRLELEGPWPDWIRECSDPVLLARVGPGPLSRGSSYARQRAVLTLSVREDGDLVTATVRGSGRSTYQTVIRPQTSRTGAHADFAGRCSCPMQIDCKHVAAVLITARDQAGRGPAAVVAPAWESRFAELVRPAPPTSTLAPLAYQFEVVTSASRQADVPAERVRLRPVTVGKTGRWVRTGVSWLDLEYGYGLGKIQPEHRALAREVLAAYRSSPQTRVASYHDPQTYLDDFGPQAWRLLADAQRSGIALVSAQKDQRVTVSAHPATVVLDVTQEAPEQPVELSFGFRLPEQQPLPSAGARLVGRPAHGAYLDTPERLLLVPFDQPLDSATHSLLAGGALQIPAAELPVFVSRYYPILRQRITVESSDTTVAFPEVRPPHLALTVTFEPGHETLLDWSFAYPVGDDVVHARGADDPVARDRAAEEALLAALPDVPGL